MSVKATIRKFGILTPVLIIMLFSACNNGEETPAVYPKNVDTVATVTSPENNPKKTIDTVKALIRVDSAKRIAGGSEEPSLAEASIAYAYKSKMNKGDKELVQVHVQLDKPVEKVAEGLKNSLNEQKAKETGSSDTSIVKSLTITGDKYFLVSIEKYDTSIFFIEPVFGEIKQELQYKKPNKWIWRITAKKETRRSEIFIIVKSEDDKGQVHESDISILPVEITVNNKFGNGTAVITKKTFITKYGWLMFIIMVLVIAGLLISKWLRKKHLKEANSRIYFSYAWKNEPDTIVDRLYESLLKDGFNIIRDKVNLQYRGLISSFMKDIGKSNIIIVSLSDKYLKSKFCMFELYEIYRNCGMNKEAFVKKVFPVREEDINLSDALVIEHYADYWRNEEQELEAIIKDKTQVTTSEQFAQYDAVKRIAQELGNLLNFLSDINSLNAKALSNNDFAALKQSLSAAIETLNNSN
jgi:TIR domain